MSRADPNACDAEDSNALAGLIWTVNEIWYLAYKTGSDLYYGERRAPLLTNSPFQRRLPNYNRTHIIDTGERKYK